MDPTVNHIAMVIVVIFEIVFYQWGVCNIVKHNPVTQKKQIFCYLPLRPGVSVGAGIGVGLGLDAGLDREDKNVGLTALTPVGSFGAKVGCKTKVCLFACVGLTFC